MSLSAFASVLRRAARLPRTARAYSEKPPSSAPQTLLSTCPADTPLKGVNYLKGQTTVVARPDEEYPEWLWKVLRPREWPESEMGPGGRAERAKRRKENKQRIKDENFMKTQ